MRKFWSCSILASTEIAVAGAQTALGAFGLALLSAQMPAHAATDASNFNVRNCTDERIYVCSFDKTDGSLKIPYKASSIKPRERREFGCASIGRCKVIIGVSDKDKKNQHLINQLMMTYPNEIMGGGIGLAAGSGIVISAIGGFSNGALAAGAIGGAVILAVAVGAGIGSLEIADGWGDGEVCNKVRRAAQNAGMKPKQFMQNGKKYKVIPDYALDKKGSPLVYADGTAVFTYKATQGDSCPPA